ncbi:protein-tyrosine phosphatase-like protein [Butyriboletus roseoflavus]|nr:protein-tyrosine phosphatase-like protein [Butyriboletus roseoflavus]
MESCCECIHAALPSESHTVVSVGECALVPPPQTPTSAALSNPAETGPTNPTSLTGQSSGNQGSLWIEEREGRIKVLDIKGVCDDGIDTLEPQLHPICTWIEKARLAGGRVLVHCRVGVSRSATVTIAYVMQHLGLSLVEAYLVVRSRRLSVLIQPNMRLLYNLLGVGDEVGEGTGGRGRGTVEGGVGEGVELAVFGA